MFAYYYFSVSGIELETLWEFNKYDLNVKKTFFRVHDILSNKCVLIANLMMLSTLKMLNKPVFNGWINVECISHI